MIDLHLHTTASDGLCGPEQLVRLAWRAGITTLSVTDHDTVVSVPDVAAVASRYAITAISGIEITAVVGDTDVHVLGYFFDPASPVLEEFLTSQREDRIRRVEAMAMRLADLGLPVDITPDVRLARTVAGRSIGRPQVADAMVKAGHAASVSVAFARFLGEGLPAYIPRRGVSPAEAAAVIERAGGIASLAHPGLLHRDDIVRSLVQAGFAAIEVYHSDHDADTQAKYLRVARDHDLAVTGGSDYHGEGVHHAATLGGICLPLEEFDRLVRRAGKTSF